jgi:DNA-binding NarL/FixJ family response regulator
VGRWLDDATTMVVATTNCLTSKGLAELVKDVDDLVIVDVSRDALSAFAALQTHRPDLLVLDSSMAQALRRLVRPSDYYPRVILLGATRHLGAAYDFVTEHVCGFIGARAETEAILALIRTVARCDFQCAGLRICTACPARCTMQLPELPLSEREYEVFARIGRGHQSSGIAAALRVSVKTVETYRENIKRKLELSSAYALTAAATAWHVGDFSYDELLDASPQRPRFTREA